MTGAIASQLAKLLSLNTKIARDRAPHTLITHSDSDSKILIFCVNIKERDSYDAHLSSPRCYFLGLELCLLDVDNDNFDIMSRISFVVEYFFISVSRSGSICKR